MCEGDKCMDWIMELDETGKATGRGRCGMVFPVMPVCTCAVEPVYDVSMPIMEWGKN